MSEHKYLANGRIVRVLSTLPDGQFVVELGYEIDDSDIGATEPTFDGTQIVRKVYDKPPREAIDKEIAELQERAAELEDKVEESRALLRDANKSFEARIKYLGQFAGLERIEQFISGEITHYVIDSSLSVAVLAVEDARSTSESRSVWDGRKYHKPLRMLQLFGDPRRREVEWRLSPYSDGSGYGEACFPFTSEQAARAKAKELLDAKVAELMAKEGYMHGGNYLIDCAKKLGIELPEAFVARWKATEAKSLADSIAKAERELAELKARQVPA